MAKHDIHKVLKVGQELFRSQGYFKTGTEEILQESGFPRSSFYYHFKTKEGFAERVLEQYGASAVAFYKQFLFDSKEPSPKERIRNLYNMHAKLTEESGFRSQCLIQKMSGEAAAQSEAIRIAADRQLDGMIGVLTRCIKEGQELGEFDPDTDAQVLAEYVHAFGYGLQTHVRLNRDPKIMDRQMDRVLSAISA